MARGRRGRFGRRVAIGLVGRVAAAASRLFRLERRSRATKKMRLWAALIAAGSRATKKMRLWAALIAAAAAAARPRRFLIPAAAAAARPRAGCSGYVGGEASAATSRALAPPRRALVALFNLHDRSNGCAWRAQRRHLLDPLEAAGFSVDVWDLTFVPENGTLVNGRPYNATAECLFDACHREPQSIIDARVEELCGRPRACASRAAHFRDRPEVVRNSMVRQFMAEDLVARRLRDAPHEIAVAVSEDIAPLHPLTPGVPRRVESAEDRGDAAAATWIFRGGASRRRRGCHVDIPGRYIRRGEYSGEICRGDAAAARWIFRGDTSRPVKTERCAPQDFARALAPDVVVTSNTFDYGGITNGPATCVATNEPSTRPDFVYTQVSTSGLRRRWPARCPRRRI